MFVVGKREMAEGKVSVRIHGEGDRGVHALEAILPVLEEANRPGKSLALQTA